MSVYSDILDERIRQDAKWGVQEHEHPMWSVIFNEEWGEANQAWLHWVEENCGEAALYREELVQAAAVLVNMIECHDRAMNEVM